RRAPPPPRSPPHHRVHRRPPRGAHARRDPGTADHRHRRRRARRARRRHRHGHPHQRAARRGAHHRHRAAPRSLRGRARRRRPNHDAGRPALLLRAHAPDERSAHRRRMGRARREEADAAAPGVDLELRRGHEALSPVRLAVAFALVLSGCAPSEAPPRGTLFFGGDVMFGRLLPEGFRPYDTLPARPRDAADLAVVNLETALCDPDALERDALAAQRHLLVAPTAKARRLRDAGVDVAVVANNHALDCGAESLERTLRALDAVGIVSVGARTRGDGSFPTVVVERPWGEVVITAATMHPSPIPSSSLVPAVLFERDRDAWLDHV